MNTSPVHGTARIVEGGRAARSRRAPSAPTAEQKARADLSTQPGLAVLADALPETLLDAMIQLTHRIHVGEGRGSRHRPMTEAEVEGLRAQRNLVRAEALRRMGEVSAVTETLTAVADAFDTHRRNAAAAASRCADENDAAGLLASEYERTAWARAAREIRAVGTAVQTGAEG